MAIRPLVGVLVLFALACATPQTSLLADPGASPRNSTAVPRAEGSPFVAPPEPLPSAPGGVWLLQSDPRFLVSERPELYATALMVLPATRARAELLAVLDAWLRDETFLGEAAIEKLPCASGAACVAVAPQDPERLIQRVRSGVLSDRDGLSRAAARARAQIATDLTSPSRLAALVLSAAPSFERAGPRFFETTGVAELGEAVQTILDRSTVCLIVPNGASRLGAPWPGPMPSENGKRAENPENQPRPEVILVPHPGEEPPLVAWAMRSPRAEAPLEDERLAAEILFRRLEEQDGPVHWNRFGDVAGAWHRVEVDTLVDSVRQLQSAGAPSDRPSASNVPGGGTAEAARRAVALRRLDFGACERSLSAEVRSAPQTDIVLIGPSSLASVLEAAGVTVRTITMPR